MRLHLGTIGRVGLGALWLLHAGCSDDATAVDEDSTGTATDAETGTGGELVCTPGTVEACTCSDGASGERQCVSDGSGYGACGCDPSGTTSDTGEDTTTGPDSTDTDPSETGETETDTEDTGVDCTDDCSMVEVSACQEAVCNQEIGQCELVDLADGTDCSSFCLPDGVCAAGACVGTQNDCGLVPEQCEVVTCDDQTETCGYGAAVDGTACVLDDLCLLDPVCDAGVCVETDSVDCGGGNACLSVECNPGTGECEEEVDDGAICTSTYFLESFASCVGSGWGLFGDWQCGTPTVGPNGCIDGSHCIGTVLAGDYNHNQSYDMTVAELPPIDLTGSTSPLLAYWHWVDTEGSSYDGYHLSISTSGSNWSVLETVEPPYPLIVAGAPAYGGRIQSWERVTADLSAYAGQTVWLRFAFRSDGSIAYPGVFIDDVRVAEPQAILLSIETPALMPAAVGEAYEATLQRSGGTDQAQWSIVGGVNEGWLTIDPITGVLSGTPTAADLGPVQITIRVQEPSLPENFAERTYDLGVVSETYSESFESCPADWTLGGDWQCGVPTSGPGAAYDGNQCIATVLAGTYNNNQAWDVATATSPAIALSAGTALLRFRIWLDTEGSTYDGTNLKISTNGGATFDVVTSVTPAYPLTVNGQPAWGGDQSAAGWQEFTADLTDFAGETIQLQFGFRSDGSIVRPGVYVDHVRVLN